MEVQKIKDFIDTHKSSPIKQSLISSTLKMNPSRVSEIIGLLEDEGILEKRKFIQNGHQINTIVLVKNVLEKSMYKIDNKILSGEREVPKTGKIAQTMFDSPCLFCKQLETCGEDSTINFYNCPKLNEWISKPLLQA